MANYALKQNDTKPPLVATLKNRQGAIVLTEATGVKLLAKLKGASLLITGACTISKPLEGIVEYAWKTGDTETPGEYELEFEITWTGGGRESVPTIGYAVLQIEPDLG